jgi:trimeric autotransporter adhesin
LRYAEFVVPLVKAVQELSQSDNAKDITIQKQQKQIDELKDLVSQLVSSGSSMNDGTAKVSFSNESDSPILGQNIPNPFDNSTIIPFRIPKDCNGASIVISESGTGRVVTAIPISCSETHVAVEAGNLASGSYTYSLYVDGKMIDTKSMVLTK